MINHVSYLDALVMGEAFMPCGLAKVRPDQLCELNSVHQGPAQPDVRVLCAERCD